MHTKLKHLFDQKASGEFQDSVLGVLVSRHSGVWVANIPFQSGSVSLLMPGTRQQPDATCLAHAHRAVAALPDFVRAAREFAAHKRPELSGERLVFAALNYFRRVAIDDFGLDFTEVGNDSGNCWQVDFRSGQPVELDYT
jgi:hypothetical protein